MAGHADAAGVEADALLPCIGMFGVGVGMLYTPVLVDRMQLTYPSGLAVANILRALTDKTLLQAVDRQPRHAAPGSACGAGGWLVDRVPCDRRDRPVDVERRAPGIIVGSRIARPGIVVADHRRFAHAVARSTAGWARTSRSAGSASSSRSASILGAAIVDMTLIARRRWRAGRARRGRTEPLADWQATSHPDARRSGSLFWGVGRARSSPRVLSTSRSATSSSPGAQRSSSRWSTASRTASPTRTPSRQRVRGHRCS